MFSIREKKIITIVGKKQLTLKEISKELFKNDKNKPLDDEITIANSINRIIKKCSVYKVDWTLFKNKTNNKLIISKERIK